MKALRLEVFFNLEFFVPDQLHSHSHLVNRALVKRKSTKNWHEQPLPTTGSTNSISQKSTYNFIPELSLCLWTEIKVAAISSSIFLSLGGQNLGCSTSLLVELDEIVFAKEMRVEAAVQLASKNSVYKGAVYGKSKDQETTTTRGYAWLFNSR